MCKLCCECISSFFLYAIIVGCTLWSIADVWKLLLSIRTTNLIIEYFTVDRKTDSQRKLAYVLPVRPHVKNHRSCACAFLDNGHGFSQLHHFFLLFLFNIPLLYRNLAMWGIHTQFLWGCLTIILVIKAEIILNKSCTWCFARKMWQYCIKIRANLWRKL